jgi:dTDP-4-amino-4,6-dideoxygalactose transaminase
VDKYTWVDIGSSYLPGEIVAAFLWAQMREAEAITRRRLAIWDRYHAAFADLEQRGLARRPIAPERCAHNAHMYYLLLKNLEQRTRFIARLKAQGVNCVFHYVPLHSAPFGRSRGRVAGDMEHTDRLSERLARLPLWLGIEDQLPAIIEAIRAACLEFDDGSADLTQAAMGEPLRC